MTERRTRVINEAIKYWLDEHERNERVISRLVQTDGYKKQERKARRAWIMVTAYRDYVESHLDKLFAFQDREAA
jgi:hypothetical protein